MTIFHPWFEVHRDRLIWYARIYFDTSDQGFFDTRTCFTPWGARRLGATEVKRIEQEIRDRAPLVRMQKAMFAVVDAGEDVTPEQRAELDVARALLREHLNVRWRALDLSGHSDELP